MGKSLLTLLFLSTLIWALPSPSKNQKSSKKSRKTSSVTRPSKKRNTHYLSSKVVTKYLVSDIPKQLCATHSRLMRCHTLHQRKCLDLTDRHVRKCIKKQRLPQKITGIDSLRLGEKVGLCLKKSMKPLTKRLKRPCRPDAIQ